MQTLAAGVAFLDLDFQQTPHVIATVAFTGHNEVGLIDPGPSSTLPTLRRGLAAAGLSTGDVTAILLTHIHLDHAGSTGTLLREHPGIRVYVHRVGVPHLIDPSKLLNSAARLYGDAMERLWAEVLPVPAEAITALEGGEQLRIGGRTLDVAYTPGHASHHVSFFNGETGLAFVGDTAGVRLGPINHVLPPTPPPDIDLESWEGSLAAIEAWRPETLFLTHFGPAAPVGVHLADLRADLDAMAGLVRRSLERPGSDEDREHWFVDEYRLELVRRLGEADARAYETAARLDLSWRGLARYWRKRSF
jgi:glyoxylase-like metal-dependent hydrolase (beta-lactamase superfamily II)